MIQTQFPLSNRNYKARVFSERNDIPLNELEYHRKKMLQYQNNKKHSKNFKDNFYWVCCIENGYSRGYKINEERYYIWFEGGQKLQALIKYLKEQEKVYT